MGKYIRTKIKQEKRMIKLMYKKGVFKELNIPLDKDVLDWEFTTEGKAVRKRKNSKYKRIVWLPELHLFTWDYWGEGDSRSVTQEFIHTLQWNYKNGYDEEGYPNFKYISKEKAIKILQKMKTVNFDNKIKDFLKINHLNN